MKYRKNEEENYENLKIFNLVNDERSDDAFENSDSTIENSCTRQVAECDYTACDQLIQTTPTVQHEHTNEGNEDITISLKKWAVDNIICYSAVDELLVLLRKEVLPQLPKSSKTFLGVKYDYEIKKITNIHSETISYIYFGLQNQVF